MTTLTLADGDIKFLSIHNTEIVHCTVMIIIFHVQQISLLFVVVVIVVGLFFN